MSLGGSSWPGELCALSTLEFLAYERGVTLSVPLGVFGGVSSCCLSRGDTTGVLLAGNLGAAGLAAEGVEVALPAMRGASGVLAVLVEARAGLSGRLVVRSDDIAGVTVTDVEAACPTLRRLGVPSTSREESLLSPHRRSLRAPKADVDM